MRRKGGSERTSWDGKQFLSLLKTLTQTGEAISNSFSNPEPVQEPRTFVNMFGEEDAILTAARRSTLYASRIGLRSLKGRIAQRFGTAIYGVFEWDS